MLFYISGSILFIIWCVAWVFSGPEVLPNGGLFGLLIIFYCALIGGKLLEIIKVTSVPKIPPLLGKWIIRFYLSLTICKLWLYSSQSRYNLELFQCNMIYIAFLYVYLLYMCIYSLLIEVFILYTQIFPEIYFLI